ncbi:hypothetical protein ALC57_15895 [Trachymyrmex cornetzi]|uniref:Uncharacterized protein n=1 Tax=Trachymyrmex cornetzi TaxID=471704 RepID=A0A151IVQ1_9HYME|nr:hypothetical protein ALC57_15895 [Trachymyrmex cornetzi]
MEPMERPPRDRDCPETAREDRPKPSDACVMLRTNRSPDCLCSIENDLEGERLEAVTQTRIEFALKLYPGIQKTRIKNNIYFHQ